MSDMITALKGLANRFSGTGGRILKATAIELFLETYHSDIVERFSGALAFIKPEDVAGFIRGDQALPIPPQVFHYLQGYEDYLESFEPGRLFEFIAEADPLIAAAIMDMGDEGAAYMVKFKQFVLDSVKDLSPEVEEEEAPQDSPGDEGTVGEEGEEGEEGEGENPPGPAKFRVTIAADKTPPGAEQPAQPPSPPAALKPSTRRKRLTCNNCNYSWLVTEEEHLATTECPECHEPA